MPSWTRTPRARGPSPGQSQGTATEGSLTGPSRTPPTRLSRLALQLLAPPGQTGRSSRDTRWTASPPCSAPGRRTPVARTGQIADLRRPLRGNEHCVSDGGPWITRRTHGLGSSTTARGHRLFSRGTSRSSPALYQSSPSSKCSRRPEKPLASLKGVTRTPPCSPRVTSSTDSGEDT